jgi:hypothetical protein
MTANPATVTWTGNGNDNNWSTAANWDTNAVPQAGDDLVFDANASQLNSMNDLDAGTHFNSITFGGAGYTINGNDIFLHAGISNTSGGTDIYAGRLFLLDEGQVMNVSNGGTLILADVVTSFGVPTIEKTGAGKLVVQSPNDLDATFTVSAGTLEINGSQATGVEVSGGTFQGAGTVGGINATGGTVAAIIGTSPVTLTSTGDVAIGNGSTLNAKIDDAATYSSLSVTGSVTLGGALSLNVGYSATVGDAYTLISNDGSDAVVGTFSGLAEGSTVAAAGQRFRISYAGGDGNDVVLTRVQDGSTTSVVSSGATVYGQNVTFTATVAGVAPQAAAPAGTVQFYDGATALGGPVTLDGNGQAQLTIGSLSRATHTITAVYSGTPAYAASTSSVVSQVVSKSTSSISVNQGNGVTVFGETATFTVTVSAAGNGSGTPTGTVRFLDGVTTLGTQTLVNGQATLNLSNLPVGTRTITALFSGDGNFSSSSTPVGVSHTVSEASTTTVVTSSSATSTYHDQVTFTATVSAAAPGVGTPTGSVTFFDGMANLGTRALSSGQASIDISSLTGGSHTITAVYNDDANFVTSTSGNFTQTVNAAATTTVVESDNSPSTYGDQVTFTATVSSDAGLVGAGTVSFYDGQTLLGSAGVDASGVATYGMTTLGAGSHTITAVYGATTNFAGSTTAEGVEQAIAKAQPTVSVSTDNNSTGYSDSVTFTVTVGSGSTTPTGVVKFFDGETQIGSQTLDNFGEASIVVSTLDAGSHTITAEYQGDGNFLTGSDDVSQTVAIATTTTTVSTSNNHTTYNDQVTYTATVTSGVGIPVGDVKFYDGQTLIGTQTLDIHGEAQLQIRNLGAGSHTIHAEFQGSTDFDTSSDQVAQQVDPSTSSVTAVSAGDTRYGQTATITATVTGINGGMPTGTVEFYNGNDFIGSQTVDEDGIAALEISTLDVGSYSISAVYDGDDNHVFSQTGQNVALNVAVALTTVEVSVPSGNSTFGDTVTLTATVSSDDATPTGSVDFYDGVTLLGSQNLDGNGQATLDVSNFSSGSHANLHVVYAGTSNFNGNVSDPIGLSVAKADTAVSVSSSGTSTYSDQVTLTATVSADHGTPTGTVTFYEGSTVLGSDTLSNGSVSITISSLGGGDHTITAVYGGASDYNGQTSDEFTQTVNKASVQVWYSIPGGQYAYGDPVTVTATIHTNAGTPTGAVKLMDGDTVLDTQALVNGSADLDGSGLSGGMHDLTVVYEGDADFAANSTLFGFDLDAASSTTVVGVSGNATTYGGQAEFTATVSSTAGTPTGNVQFYANGDAIGTAVALDANGVATLDISSLGAGSYTITASYAGDGNFDTSDDQVGGSQVVNQASTSVTTPTVAPANNYGESVSISATVSSNAGTPGGQIEFFDGVTSLGTVNVDGDGVATLNTSSLGLGSHSITAQYVGTANYAASSLSSAATTVVKSQTSTTISPSVNPSVHGQQVTLTVTVAGIVNGAQTPTGTVDLYDGQTLVQTLTLDGQGVATWSGSALSTGSHSFTAVYAGDSVSVGSQTASATSQVVNKATTTTAASVSKLLTVHGESVNLIATVTTVAPGAGAAAGSVQFYVDGVSYGDPVSLVNGVATLAAADLSTTIHTITAVYSGNADFTGSSDNAGAPEVVSKDPGNFVVTSSSLTSVHGQTVTFTATISATAPGAGTPTGTVVFLDGITPLSQALTLVNGTVSIDLSNLGVGSHDISIVYSGDVDFTGGSPHTPITQVVNKTTATATVGSAGTSVHGQSVTVTVNMGAASPGTGVPTGTVTFKSDGVAISGAIALVNGAASFDVSSLGTGTHTLTVDYSGDATFTSGTGLGNGSQVVNQATANATVVVDSGTSSYHGSVTFTATMGAAQPGAGVPTGTVTFMDGQTSLGTVSLINGMAQLTVSTLAVGDHSITVVYSGDSDFVAGDSTAASETVSKASTSVGVISSGDSTFGDSVTFTATVSSGAGVGTGNVNFYDGETLLGSAAIDGSGVASLTTSALHAGSHNITVSYEGDGSYLSSDSDAITQVVGRATSSVLLETSADSIVYGSNVVFTATVSTGAGDATGTVTFYDGEQALDTVNVVNGVATLTTDGLASGDHQIVAVYGGDDDHHGSQSSEVSQEVIKASSALSVSVQATSTYGDTVTLTADATSIAGIPSGTVSFYDGEQLLGTVSLEDGEATLEISSLGAGEHLLTATYGGDDNHEGSDSNVGTLTVAKASSGVSISTSTDSVVYGTGVTVTVLLTGPEGAASLPTGTVELFDGETDLGSVELVEGVARLDVGVLSAGEHVFTATYAGDANYEGSQSDGYTQSVTKATPVVTLESSGTSTYGDTITLTATVSSRAGVPGGTVTFTLGETVLGTAAVDDEGMASVEVNWLGAGEYTINASYSGESNFNGADAAGISQVVNKAESTTTLETSGTSTYGGSVTLTAHVGSGPGTPSGTVIFKEGETVLGTAIVDEDGNASISVSSLAAGSHDLTAEYSGNGDTLVSSGGVTQTVNKASANVGLQVSASTPNENTQVTFTATVGSGVATPTGTVTFKDGQTVLATVELVNGVAVYSTSGLAIGGHTITATYNGAANYNDATSQGSTVTVQDVSAPTAAATVKDVTRVGGNKVTFTVTFSDASGINGATVNNNSNVVQVIGPKGFVVKATFVSITVGQNGSRTVTYSFTPPGGTWDAADAGTYTIKVLGNVVKDSVGNTMAYSTAGSFYMSPTPFFDERYYLVHNSDVATAVANGTFSSGYQHFIQYGQFGGRDASAAYSEKRYLAFNPDVAAAVKAGVFKSGWDHLMKYGIKDKRKVNAFFDETFYLAQNPDVLAAVKAGMYKSGLEHYLAAGQFEGRSPSVYFNDALYRAQNPSVAGLVQSGQYASAFQHFLLVGQESGLSANNFFSETFYLNSYPDVAQQVANHVYKSGLEQYIIAGISQGKVPNASAKPRKH